MGRAPRSRYFMEGEKPIPSGQRHGQEPQPRIIAFMILVLVTFAMFGIRILWLQTAEGAHYQDLADQNRYKLVALEAPRGVMYDRNGQLMVRNRPSFNIVAVPAILPDDETEARLVLQRLDSIIAQSEADLPIHSLETPVAEEG